MKRRTRSILRSNIGLVYFLLLSLFSFSSQAAFDVFDEDTEGYYGNAEKIDFKNDIEGTEALSPRDRAFLESVEINRITQRWYMRALVGKSKTKISDISNNSSYPYNMLTVATSSVTENLYQLLVAGGYLWEHWAVEGELFFTKELNYNSSPIFANYFNFVATNPTFAPPPFSAQSKIQQIGLLINLQYIIPRYFDWYPQHLQIHLDAGAGPILKKTNTNTFLPDGSTFVSGSAQTLTGIGKLGLGTRYQIATHFLVDISYFYLFLGKTDFGPVGGIKAKSTKMQSNGFFFGLTYQF